MGCLENLKIPVVIKWPEATGDGKGESFVLSCIMAAIPKINPNPKTDKPEQRSHSGRFIIDMCRGKRYTPKNSNCTTTNK